MKNQMQLRIDEMIRTNKTHSRFVALMLVLCTVLSFVLPAWTMTPAIAQTTPQGLNLEEKKDAEDSLYFAVGIGNPDDPDDYKVVYNSYPTGTTDAYDEIATDIIALSVDLTYHREGITSGYFPETGPHMYLDIRSLFADGTKFDLGSAATGNIEDTEYMKVSGGAYPGTYEITDDGYVLLTLTEDYIAYAESAESGGAVTGMLDFSGMLNRNESAEGDQTFTIAGQEVTVKFSDSYPTVEKTASLNRSDATVTWIITIRNDGGVNLNGYHFSDKMLGSAMNGVTTNPTTLTYQELSDGVYQITSDVSQDVILQYTTAITAEMLKEGKTENEAAIWDKDSDTPDSNDSSYEKDDETVYLGNPVTVNKVGKTDYSVTHNPDQKITWTITLNSVYGVPLDGFVLTDTYNNAAFAFPDDVTVSPQGSLTALSDGKYQLTGTNATSVTITYTADAKEGANNSNEVKLYYSDGTTPVTDKKADDVYYYKESDFYSLSKNGTYNNDTGKITWTVEASAQYGVNLNGYELTDTQFPADISGFNFANGGDYVTYDSANHKLTVTGDIPYLRFTYQTDPTDVDFTKTDTQYVKNTIEDNHGNKKEPSASVTPRDTVTKTYTSSNYSTAFNKQTYNEIKQTLNWTASLTYDGGFGGYLYTDTLSATSGSTHQVNPDSIVVLARSTPYDENTTLVNGTDYTVIETADGFQIKFADTVSSEYHYVSIAYSTTVTVPAGTDNYGTYTFSNKGTHGAGGEDGTGPYGEGSYTITKTDPQKQLYQNLTVNKYWRSNVSELPVDHVTFKLQYYTSEDSTWRDVKQSDGAFIFAQQHDGTENSAYTSAQVLEMVLNKDGSWTQALNDLPRQVDVAVNGDYDHTVYYYYRVVETKVGDTDVSDGRQYVILGSDICEVGSSSTSYPGSSTSSLGITNHYYAPISLDVSKNWQGNAGTGSHFSTVQFKLQYSLNNGTYQDLYMSGEQYIFGDIPEGVEATLVAREITKVDDSWIKYTFSALPVRIEINGTLYSVKYRAIELSADGTEVKGNKLFVNDGYYTVSNSGEAYNASSTLTLTNTFRKSEDIPITVEKKWNGDNETIRPFSITVALQQSTNNANWETIATQELNSSNNWTYQWTGLAPNQAYDAETGAVTTYYYSVVETGYTVTADGEFQQLATNGLFTTDASKGYYTVYQHNGTFSGIGEKTATITNTFNTVKTTTITPKKNWASDKDFAQNNRPSEIKLQLQQSTVGSSTWVNYGDPITLSGDKDSSQWVADAFTNLPNSAINVDANGNVTRVDYQYRLVEVDSNNNEITSIATGSGTYKVTNSGAVTTNDWTPSTELVVTNTFSEDIGINKHIIDKNGKEISELTLAELDNPELGYKHTINNVDYYIFNWAIGFDSKKSDLYEPVADKLPDGFSLVYYSDVGLPLDTDFGAMLHSGGASYTSVLSSADVSGIQNDAPEAQKANITWPGGYYRHPNMCYEGSFTIGLMIASSVDKVWSQYKERGDCFYYDADTNTVYFNCPNSSAQLYYCYSTQIKCDDLKTLIGDKKKYVVSNNAVKYHQTSSNEAGVPTDKVASASVTIRNDQPVDIIRKGYTDPNVNGLTAYTLDINPESLNLSTGSTIDITDLFETTSYYDHVNGETYYGTNLVDVIMSSINIYRVSANGVRTKLQSNEYIVQFDSGTQTENGAALLNLTVPDETHLLVEYVYELVANENTPSVINGRNSSIKKNGRYLKMVPGLTPPNKDSVTFSNEASLKTESAEGSSKYESEEYIFARSSGSIWTEKMPTLVKVDVSDYLLSDLETTFLLAKYSDGAWYYATSVNAVDGSIEWSTTAYRGSSVDESAGEIFVDGEFMLDLTTDVLYKLVEVAVPEGYEGSNLTFPTEDGQGTIVYGDSGYNAALKELIINYLNSEKQNTVYRQVDYAAFLEKFTPVYYFTYNSDMATLPSGVSSDEVQKILQNGELNVTNNQLINVSVEKAWIQDPGDATATVDVELYWSYTKDTTKIPDDALVADAKTLGLLDTSFEAVKTVPTGTTKGVWTDLPNGIEDRVIYYYVKEIAYTVNDVKYSLQADGTYKSESDTALAYYPTYVNNAVSSDGTVTIKNSQTLRLHKIWKDANGNETTKVPFGSIAISVYGIHAATGDEVPLFENVIVRSADGWYTDLPTISENLDQYSSFVVKENGEDLEDYIVSCVYSINHDTGEITVTNRDTTLTEEAVTLNKLWSDGADAHASEKAEFKLYYSTSDLFYALRDGTMNLTQFLMAAESPKLWPDIATIGAEEGWSYAWTGLPTKDSNGQRYYYYVFETSSAENYTPKYVTIDNTSIEGNTQYTINNFRSAILVGKEWIDADGNKITDTSLLPEITLDIYNGEPPETNAETPVAPPVVETETEDYIANIPNKDAYKDFVTFADVNAALRDPAKMATDGCHPNQDGYNAIADTYFEAIKKLYPDPAAAGTLNIVALGDSITEGYGGANPTYPARLATLLINAGYSLTNSTVVNAGVSTIQVINFPNNNNYSQIGASTDIILLLGGTNDIHQSGSDVKGSAEGVYGRLTDLIDILHADNKAPQAKIIVGSIPYFVFETSDGTITEGGGWWYNAGSSWWKNSDGEYTNGTYTMAELIEINNGEISLLNYGIKDILTDTTEPETPTVEKIDTIKLNKDNNWSATVDVPDDGSYYYIKEETVPEGWEVSYTNNGLMAGSTSVMTATNTFKPETTSVSVQKTWVGDQEESPARDTIAFKLLRTLRRDVNGESTANINDWYWEEMDVTMPTPTKVGNVWTYVYQDLPEADMYGNDYYYKVEEQVPTGYSATYGTDTDTQQKGIAEGTLYVTNTMNISILLKKEWSNLTDTTGYEVVLQIFRDTKKDANADGVKLILTLSAYEVTVDKNTTDSSIVANKAVTATSADETVATVTVTDGRILNITGVAEGTTTITVTEADGKDTRTLTVNVVKRPIELNEETLEISQGSTDSTIVANKVVQASSSDESVATVTVGADGKTLNIVGVGAGTTTIEVTDGEETKTITVTVTALNFAMGNTMSVGEKLDLCVTEGATDVTSSTAFSFSEDGYLHYNETDKSIIALKPGTVTITATKDGKSTTQTVTIGLPDFTLTSTVTDGKITEGGNATLTLEPSVAQADSSLTYDYGGFTWISGNMDYITVTPSADGLSATVNAVAVTSEAVAITATNQYDNQKKYSANIIVEASPWTYVEGAYSDYPTNNLISDASKIKTITFMLVSASGDCELYLKFADGNWPAINLKIQGGKFVYQDDGTVRSESGGSDYVDCVLSADGKTATLTVKKALTHIQFGTDNKNVKFGYKYTTSTTPRPAVPVIQANSNTTSTTTESTTTSSTTSLLSKIGVGLRFSTAQQTLSEIAEASENSDLLTVATTEGVRTVDLNDTSFADDNCITVTLTNTDNFEAILSDLDVYDADGNKYYYWAQEVAVTYNGATVSGFTPSYSFTDQDSDTTYSINAEKAEGAVITVRNTKDESVSAEMPESGGSGTAPYTATGIMLISMAGIYFLVKRRREESDA